MAKRKARTTGCEESKRLFVGRNAITVSASRIGRKSDVKEREREDGEGRQMDEVCVVCSKPNSYPLDTTPAQTKLFFALGQWFRRGAGRNHRLGREKQAVTADDRPTGTAEPCEGSHRYWLRLY